MFWLSAAFATGFSAPPQIAWVDAKCNPLDEHALPADQELRLLWSQTSSTSPPGGPVHSWTDTLDPEHIRLRQQGCGVETARFEKLKKTCGDVPVLRWAGPLKRGASYAVENAGHPVAHMRVAGPKTSTCNVPPLEPRYDEHTVGPVSVPFELPARFVTVDNGRTYVELSTQRALAGTLPHLQPRTFQPIVGRPGEATVQDGTVAATWTVTRQVYASTIPDRFGDATCSVEVRVEAALTVPGVDGAFEQAGPTTIDATPGACKPGAGVSLATEDAIRADLDARLATLSSPVPATEPNDPHGRQRRELEVTLQSQEYRDDPITALEGLVRQSGWREPGAAILLAEHLSEAGRHLEAAHRMNQALRNMPIEPSPPRAPLLLFVAESAAAGIDGCEGQRCYDISRIGGEALTAYQSIHPDDPRSDAVRATLRAAVGR